MTQFRIRHPDLDREDNYLSDLEDNEDYGCGVHSHDKAAHSGDVKEWLQRHGNQNPSTGALVPKVGLWVQEPLAWPRRQWNSDMHERVYQVLSDLARGRPILASLGPIDGVREEADPDFQAIINLTRSPEWRRSAFVQQLYPATKGRVANRQSHGIEAGWVAGYLALHMGLNPWRAVAAAIAHDIGHPSFAHGGESALRQVLSTVSNDHGSGFEHGHNGFRVVMRPHIGFTPEAADAVGQHTWSLPAGLTAEAALVSIADRIAYISSDLRDLLNVGVMQWEHVYDLTPKVFQLAKISKADFNSLGARLGPDGIADAVKRALTEDVMTQFWKTNEIGFTAFGAAALTELRSFIPDQTFRAPKHKAWEAAQYTAALKLLELDIKDLRKKGLSDNDATVEGGNRFTARTDAEAYDVLEQRGYKAAAKLRQGPPTKEAVVQFINRPGKRPDLRPLAPLAYLLPPLTVTDRNGRKADVSVPDAVMALRVVDHIPEGQTRPLAAVPDQSGDGKQMLIEIPGRNCPTQPAFVAQLRAGLVASVTEAIQRQRVMNRFQSSAVRDEDFIRGVDRLVNLQKEATMELLIARSGEHGVSAAEVDLTADDLVDVAVKACTSYANEHFAKDRPVETRTETSRSLYASA